MIPAPGRRARDAYSERAMSEVLILEFEGFGAETYERVNGILGINADSGEGDWPAGMHTHLAGPTAGGGWMVIEVWESQEDQDPLMKTRLCPAPIEARGTSLPNR